MVLWGECTSAVQYYTTSLLESQAVLYFSVRYCILLYEILSKQWYVRQYVCVYALAVCFSSIKVKVSTVCSIFHLVLHSTEGVFAQEIEGWTPSKITYYLRKTHWSCCRNRNNDWNQTKDLLHLQLIRSHIFTPVYAYPSLLTHLKMLQV